MMPCEKGKFSYSFFILLIDKFSYFYHQSLPLNETFLFKE